MDFFRQQVLKIFGYNGFTPSVSGPTSQDDLVGIVLDRTAFYAEAGGQVSISFQLVPN